jgi:putative MATE family efflux protein
MDGESVNPEPSDCPPTVQVRELSADSGIKSSEASLYRHRSQATWRLVLKLAWPVLAQQFLILAVGLSDRFLAGHFPPPEATRQVSYQAAQTTAQYLAWLITCYTVLVSVGSTALVARFIGAGDRALAVKVTHQSILLAVAFGLAGTVAGLLGMNALVGLLQLQGDAAVFAADYLRPMFVLLVFQMVESAGIACLVGAGDTMTGFLVLGAVAVLNLPLSWSLCLGLGPLPKLGFVGISLGTALSHMVGAVIVLTVLAKGRAGLGLRLHLLWPNRDLIRRLLRISVPAGVDSMSVVVGQFWFLRIVNRLGETAAGAHGIALGWEALGYLSGSAFGTAAMTLVGQNLGARQPVRAAHSGWMAFRLGCGVMCAMGIVFFLLAPQMFALFCPRPDQAPEIEAGVPVLRLVAFAMPATPACRSSSPGSGFWVSGSLSLIGLRWKVSI